MTWNEVVEKLAYFIGLEGMDCRQCPAKEYCATHNECDDFDCTNTIIAWANEQVEGEDNG
jgi:hypothetical protein